MIKKLLKSKKGFTLMELVVGLVIFGIISVSVAAALAPTLFAFMRANDFAEYNILLDNIANQIISDLSQATEEPEFDEGSERPGASWNSVTITKLAAIVRYTISDGSGDEPPGILMREIGSSDPQPVFSEDFYKRKMVSFKLNTHNAVDEPPSYTLTIRLVNTAGDFEIEREYAVRPLILHTYTPDDIEDDEENG